LSGALIKITAYALAIFVADCIILAAAGNVTMFVAGSLHVSLLIFGGLTLLSLTGLFFVNLVLFFFSSHRLVHALMALLIVVTYEFVIPLTRKWEQQTHRQWFLQKAFPEYQEAVEKILRDKTVLNDPNRLQYLVGYPSGWPWVSGETNSNGSAIIYFSGLDHWGEGHLYYSGKQTTPDPNFPNHFYLNGDIKHSYIHLTNGWYEY